MTRTITFLAAVLASAGLSASALHQQGSQATTTPVPGQRVRVSPHEVHEFDANGCHFTFNYGRPSKKGRTIWGTLVPWGKWWMPGADEATIVTTTKAIVIGELVVPEGQHSLYLWPTADVSQLIINNEIGQFHTVYHPDRDLGRVPMTLTKVTDAVEQLTYSVEPREGGGSLKLAWDDREYVVTFRVR